MDSGQWAEVGLAATIATGFATGISTVAALWWRRQDRNEADWVVYSGRSQWEIQKLGHDPDPQANGTLANAGDGIAFRVKAFGLGCCVRLGESVGGRSGRGWRELELVPAIQPGTELELVVWCEPSVWDRAQVVVAWTRSPTWKKRRSRRHLAIPLTDIAKRPVYALREFDETKGMTQHIPQPEPTPPVLDRRHEAQWPLPAEGWLKLKLQSRDWRRV